MKKLLTLTAREGATVVTITREGEGPYEVQCGPRQWDRPTLQQALESIDGRSWLTAWEISEVAPEIREELAALTGEHR